jgi:hypothetical protein
MWRIFLCLFIFFFVGRAFLFFLKQPEGKGKLTYTELIIYSISLGYAVLSIMGVILAEIGILTAPITLVIIILLPVFAISYWIYGKITHTSRNTEYSSYENQDQTISNRVNSFFSNIKFSHIIIMVLFLLGITLRLESQLTVPWLGDRDPYYHLSFIDSIIIQGTLPARTFWGLYSYPPSFHVVFATLISTTQVDRYLLLKIVPEFLGFLCVPAVYTLIKREYSEWAGIASAAFLAICSMHIYRTNIAIPEPIALLGMILFFHALKTQTGSKKLILAGFFASIVFLTNVVTTLYFLPSVVGIFIAMLALKRYKDAVEYLKATLLGIMLSGIFWIPIIYNMGLRGILQGLGPSYHAGGVFSYNSSTYFSWIGWGACILGLLGLYISFKNFRKSLFLLIPTGFYLFLIEAANNGFLLFDSGLLFRSLLYLGTWISLLTGVGFQRILEMKRKKIPYIILGVLVIFTMLSFPILSSNRYPVNWGYENEDFVYRSFSENYADIFKNSDSTIYAANIGFNFGAFSNVIVNDAAPQIGAALYANDTSTLSALINQYEINYMILYNGTKEAEFLENSNLTNTYYEDWYTIVLSVK